MLCRGGQHVCGFFVMPLVTVVLAVNATAHPADLSDPWTVPTTPTLLRRLLSQRSAPRNSTAGSVTELWDLQAIGSELGHAVNDVAESATNAAESAGSHLSKAAGSKDWEAIGSHLGHMVNNATAAATKAVDSAGGRISKAGSKNLQAIGSNLRHVVKDAKGSATKAVDAAGSHISKTAASVQEVLLATRTSSTGTSSTATTRTVTSSTATTTTRTVTSSKTTTRTVTSSKTTTRTVTSSKTTTRTVTSSTATSVTTTTTTKTSTSLTATTTITSSSTTTTSSTRTATSTTTSTATTSSTSSSLPPGAICRAQTDETVTPFTCGDKFLCIVQDAISQSDAQTCMPFCSDKLPVLAGMIHFYDYLAWWGNSFPLVVHRNLTIRFWFAGLNQSLPEIIDEDVFFASKRWWDHLPHRMWDRTLWSFSQSLVVWLPHKSVFVDIRVRGWLFCLLNIVWLPLGYFALMVQAAAIFIINIILLVCIMLAKVVVVFALNVLDFLTGMFLLLIVDGIAYVFSKVTAYTSLFPMSSLRSLWSTASSWWTGGIGSKLFSLLPILAGIVFFALLSLVFLVTDLPLLILGTAWLIVQVVQTAAWALLNMLLIPLWPIYIDIRYLQEGSSVFGCVKTISSSVFGAIPGTAGSALGLGALSIGALCVCANLFLPKTWRENMAALLPGPGHKRVEGTQEEQNLKQLWRDRWQTQNEAGTPSSLWDRVCAGFTQISVMKAGMVPCVDNFSDVSQSVNFLRKGQPFFCGLNVIGILWNIYLCAKENVPKDPLEWLGRFCQSDVIEAALQNALSGRKTRLFFQKVANQARTEGLLNLPVLTVAVLNIERLSSDSLQSMAREFGLEDLGDGGNFLACCFLFAGDAGLIFSYFMSIMGLYEGMGNAQQWVLELSGKNSQHEDFKPRWDVSALLFMEAIAVGTTLSIMPKFAEVIHVYLGMVAVSVLSFFPVHFMEMRYSQSDCEAIDKRPHSALIESDSEASESEVARFVPSESEVARFVREVFKVIFWPFHPFLYVWPYHDYPFAHSADTSTYRKHTFAWYFGLRGLVLIILWWGIILGSENTPYDHDFMVQFFEDRLAPFAHFVQNLPGHIFSEQNLPKQNHSEQVLSEHNLSEHMFTSEWFGDNLHLAEQKLKQTFTSEWFVDNLHLSEQKLLAPVSLPQILKLVHCFIVLLGFFSASLLPLLATIVLWKWPKEEGMPMEPISDGPTLMTSTASKKSCVE
eukprot:TRINITY_DN1225_c0_g1_i1.p1 TRINITY_DN1225_c0_g1~~TRINITY_DN1225_c0_g1_i1.p1  ORF type:complete len:1223 (-),score=149.41 TRINITY_DN1225_c0_g1_i1:77-3745(-)